jgi:hypothetical protein
MEIKLKLDFNQILMLIHQLSISEKRKIATQLQVDLDRKQKSGNDLQRFLLKGPTWTDKEYKEFQKRRKQVNKFPSR